MSIATHIMVGQQASSLLRCKRRTIVHNISGTCAVVGSSDILRILPMGPHINRHDTVWRVNNAPEVGFGAWVGNNTHIRIINNVPLRVWTKHLIPKLEGRSSHRGREFPSDLCVGKRCLLIDTATADLQLLKNVSVNMSIQALHGIRNNVKWCTHTSTPLSAGYIAVMLAVWSCPRPVHLYGFMPHCCDNNKYSKVRRQLGWPQMNYKYSHTNVTRWVCCASGRERMDVEFEHYISLEKQGILALHPFRGVFVRPRLS